MRFTPCLLLCASFFILAGCASHHPLAAASDQVERIYDARDLFVNVPNFSLDNDKNQPTTQPSREQLVRELITTITSSVDPLSWRENTGRGTISELQGQLIVKNTPAVHERLLRKLEQMRKDRGVQVMFEARFITSPHFEKELGGTKEDWIQLKASNADLWPRFLSESEAEALRRQTSASMASTLLTAPRIVLFNGQRAYCIVSRQTAYVADLHAVGDKLEPEVKVAESGVWVECQAKASEDLKFVTLNLRQKWASLLSLNAVPWQGRKDQSIQVPETVTNALDATITMPNEQTAIYKVHPHHVAATQPVNDPEVYVLVRPRIIAQREAPAKPQNLLSRR